MNMLRICPFHVSAVSALLTYHLQAHAFRSRGELPKYVGAHAPEEGWGMSPRSPLEPDYKTGLARLSDPLPSGPVKPSVMYRGKTTDITFGTEQRRQPRGRPARSEPPSLRRTSSDGLANAQRQQLKRGRVFFEDEALKPPMEVAALRAQSEAVPLVVDSRVVALVSALNSIPPVTWVDGSRSLGVIPSKDKSSGGIKIEFKQVVGQKYENVAAWVSGPNEIATLLDKGSGTSVTFEEGRCWIKFIFHFHDGKYVLTGFDGGMKA